MKREISDIIISQIQTRLDKEWMWYPVKITNMYVFGSYAKGSENPNDLDFIIQFDGEPSSNDMMYTRSAIVKDIIDKYDMFFINDFILTVIDEIDPIIGFEVNEFGEIPITEIKMKETKRLITDTILIWSLFR